jgi:hypothetical protein
MTLKQKALAKEIIENPSSTMKDAMIKVGYSENTAVAPSQITESKGFQELMNTYLDDDETLAVHKEQLHATKVISARNGKDASAETDDFIDVPDNQARLKAIELAYRIKGKLKDGLNVEGDLNMNVTIVRHAVE